MIAEFEEKTYELACDIELALGGTRFGYVFTPGQVLEKIVGYDAAAHPDAAHPIWRILAVPRPKGMRLVPSLWRPGPPGRALPRVPVSLIFQYKRAEFMYGAAAKQWRLWSGPYYRFRRTEHQHRALRTLERAVGRDVVVRYAAPAFASYANLERYTLHGQVLDRSGFVAPAAMRQHRVWTYVAPGNFGRGNPAGREVRVESTLDLAELLRGVGTSGADVVPADAFRLHLSRLARGCRSRSPDVRAVADAWLRELRRRVPDVPREVEVQLADFAVVTAWLSRTGASWYVTAGV